MTVQIQAATLNTSVWVEDNSSSPSRKYFLIVRSLRVTDQYGMCSNHEYQCRLDIFTNNSNSARARTSISPKRYQLRFHLSPAPFHMTSPVRKETAHPRKSLSRNLRNRPPRTPAPRMPIQENRLLRTRLQRIRAPKTQIPRLQAPRTQPQKTQAPRIRPPSNRRISPKRAARHPMVKVKAWNRSDACGGRVAKQNYEVGFVKHCIIASSIISITCAVGTKEEGRIVSCVTHSLFQRESMG